MFWLVRFWELGPVHFLFGHFTVSGNGWDRVCSPFGMPPHTLSQDVIQTIRDYTHAMARELRVVGLMNVQYAVKGKTVYVIEVNPRASRTVPFVSKAIGVPLAKLAAKVMARRPSLSILILQTAEAAARRSCSSGMPTASFNLPP